MWRFKPFMPKEPVGLEGRTIDIGNLKFQVRNVIAEGGFSSVYLARDAVSQSKQYALKHMICNDEESLDLVKKEISVMKKLKGHPNVVTLVTSSIFDMGRTKEALLVMEYCERSLVNVLESRGAGYYDEKLILVIFRDVCNAVFAMHCQSPPIAHRDLKAENVLLGSDGAWKLCDFGSISTNHKCFDRAEEMGIEEDNIRKHTTPAYRAPEMWDLYRREIISEKVDIWALGCLLYRICYFKSAFDGESKLQILNGNYRIPELPKYSSVVTDLIKDMLQSSPDARPDITQVWFRVNLQLPEDLQKETPDGPISALMPDGLNMTSVVNDDNTNGLSRGNLGSSKRGHTIPKRSPPPPPQDVLRNSPPLEMGSVHHSTSADSSKSGGNGDPLGAFWSTQHAQDALISSDKGPIFDEESVSHSTFVHIQQNPKKGSSPPQEQRKPIPRPSGYGGPQKKFDGPDGDFEIRFDQDGSSFGKAKVAPSNNLKTKASYSDNTVAFQNDAFDKFVAEFDTSKLNLGNNNGTSNRSQKEELEAEVERLKEQLLHSNAEKTEITSKFEKLSAICRAQRQEIQELKQALAKASIPTPPNKESSKTPSSSGSWQAPSQKREKIEGSVFELQQEMFTSSSSTQSSDPKPWQAFTEEPKSQPPSRSNHPKSVRTSSNRHANRQTSPSATEDNWAFDQDKFSASPMNSQISKNPSSTPQISRNHGEASGSQSQRYGAQAKKASQPAGWAGF